MKINFSKIKSNNDSILGSKKGKNKGFVKWDRVIVAFGLLCLALVLVIKFSGKSVDSLDRSEISKADTSVATESEENVAVNADNVQDSIESSSTDGKINVKPLDELKTTITNELDGVYGTWSVYVQNLGTGDTISINSQAQYSASLIKLYAMAGAYEQIEAGTLNEDNLSYDLEQMITVSSNESFNSIVLDIGTYYINQWCEENGYDDTYECHGLYPSTNGDAVWTSSGINTTSVNDCGEFLASVYSGECVSRTASEKMLDLLLNQQVRTKIPAGVPDGTVVANKTGETDDDCHDVAIVYSDGGDYVLCVMATAEGMGWESADTVVKISEITYDFFNS